MAVETDIDYFRIKHRETELKPITLFNNTPTSMEVKS